ncbi:MAG: hydroxymethylglutaryl-CoA lyase, partial [Terriglobales bacterium]
PQDAVAKVLAAYDAGCRRFDCAVGGLGGCPFAQDELVGNIPTERVIEALQQRGVAPTLARPLEDVLGMSADIGGRYGARV